MPSNRISDEARAKAIRAILMFCQGEAHDMSQILAHPPVAALADPYSERIMREIVRSLARSELLFRRGQTRAAVYITPSAGALEAKKFPELFHARR